jgi:hypothetical protein
LFLKSLRRLHNEFIYLADTPFNNTDPNNWKCVVDRPQGGSVSNIGLYNVNHFLYGALGTTNVEVPQPQTAPQLNGPNLEKHAQQCGTTFGRNPNFIAVDFYDKGSQNVDLFTVVAGMNNVSYTPKPLGEVNSTGTTSTPTSSTTSWVKKGSGLYTMSSGLLFVAIVMVGLL